MKTRQTIPARIARKPVALAVLAALALPVAAYADEAEIQELVRPSSTVEAGLGWLDEDSRKFGEYTGLKEKGTYFIGNIDYLRRNVDDATYYILRGTNLGLRSRNVYVEGGRQGRFSLFAEYDQLPKFGETALTIFNGAGGDRLTLPSGFVGLAPADTAATAAGLALRQGKVNPFLQEVNLEQERKNYRFGVGAHFTRNWSANATFRREDKEGLKLFGAVVGNSGGNPRAVLAPEPVDYSTTHVEATVNYNSKAFQLQAGFYQSKFENDKKSLQWQNPFAAITGWAPAAGFPTGFGQVALPPDNDYTRLSLNGGYNFDSHTRLSFTLERGRMEQDDAFLPYTVNPALTVTTPLPRDSADAKIDTTVATANLSAQPVRQLHLHAQVRYEDMDNKTPQAQYVYIGGDSTNQATNPNSDRYRVNLPLSTTKKVFKAGGTYEFMPRTKLKFGYDYDQEDRVNSEQTENTTHAAFLGVRRSITDGVNGELTWTRSKRDGNDQCYNCIYLDSFAPQFTGPQAANNTNWDNLPIMRRFTYSDRERDKVRLQLSAAPHDMVTAQFFADLVDDEYTDTPFGLQKARTWSATGEISVTPNERVSASAYYTRDRAKYEQMGRSFNATTKPTLGFPATSPNDWFHFGEDEGDTFGVTARFVAIPKLLDFGLDASYSKMTGQLDTQTGPGITPPGLPFPELRTKLQTVKLFGTYRVRKDLAVKLQYWYQKLETNDWQWDTFGVVGIPNVITAGTVSPDYKVNFVGVSVIYRFW